jgi:hypothetical protein
MGRGDRLKTNSSSGRGRFAFTSARAERHAWWPNPSERGSRRPAQPTPVVNRGRGRGWMPTQLARAAAASGSNSEALGTRSSSQEDQSQQNDEEEEKQQVTRVTDASSEQQSSSQANPPSAPTSEADNAAQETSDVAAFAAARKVLGADALNSIVESITREVTSKLFVTPQIAPAQSETGTTLPKAKETKAHRSADETPKASDVRASKVEPEKEKKKEESKPVTASAQPRTSQAKKESYVDALFDLSAYLDLLDEDRVVLEKHGSWTEAEVEFAGCIVALHGQTLEQCLRKPGVHAGLGSNPSYILPFQRISAYLNPAKIKGAVVGHYGEEYSDDPTKSADMKNMLLQLIHETMECRTAKMFIVGLLASFDIWTVPKRRSSTTVDQIFSQRQLVETMASLAQLYKMALYLSFRGNNGGGLKGQERELLQEFPERFPDMKIVLVDYGQQPELAGVEYWNAAFGPNRVFQLHTPECKSARCMPTSEADLKNFLIGSNSPYPLTGTYGYQFSTTPAVIIKEVEVIAQSLGDYFVVPAQVFQATRDSFDQLLVYPSFTGDEQGQQAAAQAAFLTAARRVATANTTAPARAQSGSQAGQRSAMRSSSTTSTNANNSVRFKANPLSARADNGDDFGGRSAAKRDDGCPPNCHEVSFSQPPRRIMYDFRQLHGIANFPRWDFDVLERNDIQIRGVPWPQKNYPDQPVNHPRMPLLEENLEESTRRTTLHYGDDSISGMEPLKFCSTHRCIMNTMEGCGYQCARSTVRRTNPTIATEKLLRRRVAGNRHKVNQQNLDTIIRWLYKEQDGDVLDALVSYILVTYAEGYEDLDDNLDLLAKNLKKPPIEQLRAIFEAEKKPNGHQLSHMQICLALESRTFGCYKMTETLNFLCRQGRIQLDYSVFPEFVGTEFEQRCERFFVQLAEAADEVRLWKAYKVTSNTVSTTETRNYANGDKEDVTINTYRFHPDFTPLRTVYIGDGYAHSLYKLDKDVSHLDAYYPARDISGVIDALNRSWFGKDTVNVVIAIHTEDLAAGKMKARMQRGADQRLFLHEFRESLKTFVQNSPHCRFVILKPLATMDCLPEYDYFFSSLPDYIFSWDMRTPVLKRRATFVSSEYATQQEVRGDQNCLIRLLINIWHDWACEVQHDALLVIADELRREFGINLPELEDPDDPGQPSAPVAQWPNLPFLRERIHNKGKPFYLLWPITKKEQNVSFDELFRRGKRGLAYEEQHRELYRSSGFSEEGIRSALKKFPPKPKEENAEEEEKPDEEVPRSPFIQPQVLTPSALLQQSQHFKNMDPLLQKFALSSKELTEATLKQYGITEESVQLERKAAEKKAVKKAPSDGAQKKKGEDEALGDKAIFDWGNGMNAPTRSTSDAGVSVTDSNAEENIAHHSEDWQQHVRAAVTALVDEEYTADARGYISVQIGNSSLRLNVLRTDYIDQRVEQTIANMRGNPPPRSDDDFKGHYGGKRPKKQ